jgi:hypothetical protein
MNFSNCYSEPLYQVFISKRGQEVKFNLFCMASETQHFDEDGVMPAGGVSNGSASIQHLCTTSKHLID